MEKSTIFLCVFFFFPVFSSYAMEEKSATPVNLSIDPEKLDAAVKGFLCLEDRLRQILGCDRNTQVASFDLNDLAINVDEKKDWDLSFDEPRQEVALTPSRDTFDTSLYTPGWRGAKPARPCLPASQKLPNFPGFVTRSEDKLLISSFDKPTDRKFFYLPVRYDNCDNNERQINDYDSALEAWLKEHEDFRSLVLRGASILTELRYKVFYKILRQRDVIESWQAIHFAAAQGNLYVIGYLLNRGADVNAQDPFERNTPIYRAAVHGHVNAVCSLLRYRFRRGSKLGLELETKLHEATWYRWQAPLHENKENYQEILALFLAYTLAEIYRDRPTMNLADAQLALRQQERRAGVIGWINGFL
jgi:hypothetical protein